MLGNLYDNTFCGREKELQCLIDKWKLVAHSKNLKPQIVAFTAEQGLGKTRLLQAFYEWLSQHEDAKYPDGYWPDTIVSHENAKKLHVALKPVDPWCCSKFQI